MYGLLPFMVENIATTPDYIPILAKLANLSVLITPEQ